jgi:hypothetical protein
MNETAEAAPQVSNHQQGNIEIPITPATLPASPLWHFLRENCKKCPFVNTCDTHAQLRCVLCRIALDLHTLTRNDTARNRHLDR